MSVVILFRSHMVYFTSLLLWAPKLLIFCYYKSLCMCYFKHALDLFPGNWLSDGELCVKGNTYKGVRKVQADLILLYFEDIVLFTNWRSIATLHQASLWVPFFHQHLLTSCLCVTFWLFSLYFKLFHYYFICYDALWSVIFDVTTMTC